MKIPRPIVAALLVTSIGLVLVTFGWWWVIWPDRTAKDFLTLVREGSFDEAIELLEGNQEWAFTREQVAFVDQRAGPTLGLYYSPTAWQRGLRYTTYLVFQRRTLADLLAGRYCFTLGAPSPNEDGLFARTARGWEFTVRRGRISFVGDPDVLHLGFSVNASVFADQLVFSDDILEPVEERAAESMRPLLP